VRASGAGAELVALAEALSIPVATSLNAKDCIPGTHPLNVGVVGSYSRESANRVVAEADTVCFIGTETGGMTTHFWAVPKIGVAAVQIDIEPQALGRNYPLKAAVLGDAKVTLARMLAHANEDTSGSHGQSRIIAPDGNIVKEATVFGQDVVTATLELSLATGRMAQQSVDRGPLGGWWRKGIEQVRNISE
jgi:acetolactate synthase-1/2/3 large subunit